MTKCKSTNALFSAAWQEKKGDLRLSLSQTLSVEPQPRSFFFKLTFNKRKSKPKTDNIRIDEFTSTGRIFCLQIT